MANYYSSGDWKDELLVHLVMELEDLQVEK